MKEALVTLLATLHQSEEHIWAVGKIAEKLAGFAKDHDTEQRELRDMENDMKKAVTSAFANS